MTVCFIDNNIILQLAAYDLFEETLKSLSITWENLRVLNTAIYVFRGKGIAKRYSSLTIQRAITIVQRCQTVIRQPTEEFELLLEINRVDEGEASLILATVAEPRFWLATGDKNCLEALASDDRLASIRQRLTGRTICLEQILLKLILIYGSTYVQQRVLATKDCETAIRTSFGWSAPANEASILEGLDSYIKDLQRRSQGLLVDMAQLA